MSTRPTEPSQAGTVLITGACGGIGSAIARAFGQLGWRLALCDLRAPELTALVRELGQQPGAVYHRMVDVSRESEVDAFCRSSAGELGGLDVVVNTVGIVDNMGDVETLPTAVWDMTLTVNLTSAFLVAKHSVPHLKGKGGVIINISSVSGLANQANAMVYSVTKAALISLTRSEAIDLAPYGIRAVAICPGSVSTPLVDRAVELTAAASGRSPAAQRALWESQYPSGRFSTPEEIADLAVFLASDRAKSITGCAVVIDGGLTALLPER